MTVRIAPVAALSPTPPAVGIFWSVDGILVVDRSALDDAEPYGDCMTHGAGHYERWEEWQKTDISRLSALGYPSIIKSTEYDQWPRGRIVYESPQRRFILYADRRLQTPDRIDALKSVFGLGQATVIVKSDAHYR